MIADVTRIHDEHTPSPNCQRIPLSESEKLQLAKHLKTIANNFVKENKTELDNLHKKQLVLDKKMTSLNQEESTLDKKMTELDLRKAKNDETIKAAQRRMRESDVKLLFRICYGTKQPIPMEQVDTIFAKYVGEGTFTIGKENTPERKNYGLVNSMKGLVLFLKEHPDVIKLDFRGFKAHVYDVPLPST